MEKWKNAQLQSTYSLPFCTERLKQTSEIIACDYNDYCQKYERLISLISPVVFHSKRNESFSARFNALFNIRKIFFLESKILK